MIDDSLSLSTSVKKLFIQKIFKTILPPRDVNDNAEEKLILRDVFDKYDKIKQKFKMCFELINKQLLYRLY